MSAHNDNDESLALLHDLPVEVSLEQVAHMVAAFPLAAGATGWLASIKTNLNTLLMISIGTLLIGTAIYFMPASTPEVQTTSEVKLPEINAPAPISEEPQVEVAQPAAVFALPVTDTVRALTTKAIVFTEPVRIPLIAPLAPAMAPPVALPAWPSPAPIPAPTLPQTGVSNKTYDLRDFSAVESSSSADIFVEEGPWSVTASGDPDLLERLEIKMENGALKITMRNGKRIKLNDRKTLKVEVHMPQLTSVVLHGSGDINVGPLSSGKSLALTVIGSGDIDVKSVKAVDELTLLVNGSGDINCRSAIVSGHTAATVLGSGDVNADGSTGSIEVLIQGSGDVDISDMPAQSGEVTVLGSGDAVVYCTGKLEQLIKGSGSIRNVGSAGGAGKSGEE